jgi:hypothetical protein
MSTIPSLRLSLQTLTGTLHLDYGTLRMDFIPSGKTAHYTASGWGLIQPATSLTFESFSNGVLTFWGEESLQIKCKGRFKSPSVSVDDGEDVCDKPPAFIVDGEEVTPATFIDVLTNA